MSQAIKIEESWKQLLQEEFEKEYFIKLKAFLKKELEAGKTVFPPGPHIFKAFDLVPVKDVKIVILGQDPYHNPGEAMGLSFSVPKGVKVPPSLANIYKELLADTGLPIPNHGDLTKWAEQGVLLLNAFLTVEKNKPLSHSKMGWQQFTDEVIKLISQNCEHVVFLLWGNFAKTKAVLIDESKHLVLQSPHPSPLAGKGFFGNHHFTKANEYLVSKGRSPIVYDLN
jgi:uracil-DNA glycosylase